MLPTYRPGDWLLVSGWAPISAGCVVLLRHPMERRRYVVKRAVGRRGDRWWVEGDNAGASTDSRHFGPVAPDAIVGRVLLRYGRRSRP